MNKRILAWLLTLCMVLSIVPFTPLTAKVEAAITAEGDLDTTAEVWYGEGTKDSANLTMAGTLANAVTYANTAATPTYIQFQNNVTLNSVQYIGATSSTTDITIDLNGYEVDAGSNIVFRIRYGAEGATVYFTDTYAGSERESSVSTTSTNGCVFIAYSALWDVVIDGGTYTEKVMVQAASSSASYSGNITINDGATFNTTNDFLRAGNGNVTINGGSFTIFQNGRKSN